MFSLRTHHNDGSILHHLLLTLARHLTFVENGHTKTVSECASAPVQVGLVQVPASHTTSPEALYPAAQVRLHAVLCQ